MCSVAVVYRRFAAGRLVGSGPVPVPEAFLPGRKSMEVLTANRMKYVSQSVWIPRETNAWWVVVRFMGRGPSVQ